MAHKDPSKTKGKHYDTGTKGTGGKDWGVGRKRKAAMDEYMRDATGQKSDKRWKDTGD